MILKVLWQICALYSPLCSAPQIYSTTFWDLSLDSSYVFAHLIFDILQIFILLISYVFARGIWKVVKWLEIQNFRTNATVLIECTILLWEHWDPKKATCQRKQTRAHFTSFIDQSSFQHIIFMFLCIMDLKKKELYLVHDMWIQES